MGFGGGGGGDLPNHQHSSVPLSGGPLDMANVTIGSLNAGSTVYSDGNALQELIKPAVPAGEVLTFPAAATEPSWQAAGGAPIELIGTTELGADTGSLTQSWTAVNFDDYSMVSVFFNGWIQNAGTDLFIRLQNPVISTSNYYSERWVCAGGTNSSSSQTNTSITLPTNSRSYRGRIDITAADSTNTDDRCLQWFLNCICTGANAMVLQAGYLDSCNVTPVTESTGIYYQPAGGNIKAGWFSSAYKFKRT